MNMSLNNEKTMVEIPYRDLETGEILVTQCHRDNLIWVVLNKMRHDLDHKVLRDQLVLSVPERLVLEYEDYLQRIRDKIDELLVKHVLGLGNFQFTPERQLHGHLKRRLKLEEPEWIPLFNPQYCAGCGAVIPGGKRALRVRKEDKNVVCCRYNCFGLMLEAGQPNGD